MKISLKLKSNHPKLWIDIAITMGLLFLMPYHLTLPALGSEKWPGVDETIVEKVAQEHGRRAREPLINTDQGDLLLFLFLLAGTVGGFIGGYYWRILVTEYTTVHRQDRSECREGEEENGAIL
jgi:hypothetical protein